MQKNNGITSGKIISASKKSQASIHELISCEKVKNISSRSLLMRFFEIKNIPPDYRYSAHKRWELDVKEHLTQEPSVVLFSDR